MAEFKQCHIISLECNLQRSLLTSKFWCHILDGSGPNFLHTLDTYEFRDLSKYLLHIPSALDSSPRNLIGTGRISKIGTGRKLFLQNRLNFIDFLKFSEISQHESSKMPSNGRFSGLFRLFSMQCNSIVIKSIYQMEPLNCMCFQAIIN